MLYLLGSFNGGLKNVTLNHDSNSSFCVLLYWYNSDPLCSVTVTSIDCNLNCDSNSSSSCPTYQIIPIKITTDVSCSCQSCGNVPPCQSSFTKCPLMSSTTQYSSSTNMPSTTQYSSSAFVSSDMYSTYSISPTPLEPSQPISTSSSSQLISDSPFPTSLYCPDPSPDPSSLLTPAGCDAPRNSTCHKGLFNGKLLLFYD